MPYALFEQIEQAAIYIVKGGKPVGTLLTSTQVWNRLEKRDERYRLMSQKTRQALWPLLEGAMNIVIIPRASQPVTVESLLYARLSVLNYYQAEGLIETLVSCAPAEILEIKQPAFAANLRSRFENSRKHIIALLMVDNTPTNPVREALLLIDPKMGIGLAGVFQWTFGRLTIESLVKSNPAALLTCVIF